MTALTLVTEAYPVKKGDFVLVHAAAGGTGQVSVSCCPSAFPTPTYMRHQLTMRQFRSGRIPISFKRLRPFLSHDFDSL